MSLAMSRLFSINFCRGKAVSFLAALFVLCLNVAAAGPVQADQAVTPEIQAYCLKKVPDKAKAACQGNQGSAGNSLLDSVMYTASWHCQTIDAADNKKYLCILKKGQDLIRTAVDKNSHPKDAADFRKTLEAVLDKDALASDGSTTYASPDATESLPATPFCGDKDCPIDIPDPATCAAYKNRHPDKPSLEGCDANANAGCNTNSCDIVKKYVNPAIEVLTIGFGLIAAISLIMGGIQYSGSVGDAQKVTAAKTRLKMTVIAIVAYAFLYTFLEFLIPGGIF